MTATIIRLATRTSPLALFQAHFVADKLRQVHRDAEVTVVGIASAGDADLDRPIREFAARGAFTTAIDRAVADGRADIAVHSAKDLPASEWDDGMFLAGVADRADPRDVLVGSTLFDLGVGATVATGSVRRRVQLSYLRPDLAFVDLRGNIATRLSKVPNGGAVLIARAALDRMEIAIARFEVLSTTVMLPQVGQGAIGLRCRSDDEATIDRIASISDSDAYRSVCAERAFLRRLGGGCDAPVGAHAICSRDTILLAAMIASGDGHLLTRAHHSGTDPDVVGVEIAEQLLTKHGADQLLSPKASTTEKSA